MTSHRPSIETVEKAQPDMLTRVGSPECASKAATSKGDAMLASKRLRTIGNHASST